MKGEISSKRASNKNVGIKAKKKNSTIKVKESIGTGRLKIH